jgi:hypothetical protein
VLAELVLRTGSVETLRLFDLLVAGGEGAVAAWTGLVP